VEGCPARAALRCGTEAVVKQDPLPGQLVQRQREYGWLPVTTQMFSKIVTGEKENVWLHRVKIRLI
jgi:hypothetical protein